MPDLPHVTAILRIAGLVDASWFTDEGRDRGSALHAAAHFLDEGDLDWDTVDASVVPRLIQYQRFVDQLCPEILSIEESVINEALRYCGTLDRRIRIKNREGILDIKSPFRAPWQGVQVAMYAACFDRPLARWTLHLSDERYQLIEHKSRQDWAVAKAALTIAAWKERNGEQPDAGNPDREARPAVRGGGIVAAGAGGQGV